MPELKKFPVFGDHGRVGTLTAPARFLDNRAEKTIELDGGGELSVLSDALEVQPDGSFFLRGAGPTITDLDTPPPPNGVKPPPEKLYREGYSIERVKVDRLVTEPVSQRQEGDTLILPVMEEVLVVEKRMMLREEIRITRRRDEVEEVRTVDPSLHSF